MIRRFRTWAYEMTFYLPDARSEMSLLETQADRDRVRWHIWRQLFRSRQYWLLCFLVTLLMLAAMLLPFLLVPGLRFDFVRPDAVVARLALFAYFIALSFAMAILGMWPLRRWVLRRLRSHLNEQGFALCLNCGYDLRGGMSQRCPECFAETALKTHSAQSPREGSRTDG